MNDVLAECRSMARALVGQPVYVEDLARVADLPVHRGDCYGWTLAGGYFDWNLAERIGERWEGPAPMAFIDVDAIRQDASAGCLEECLRTVACHELAHHDWRQEMLDIVDLPAIREFQLKRLKRWSEAAPVELGEPLDPHGPEFIRRAIHLFIRAERLGYSLALKDLLGVNGVPSSGYSYLPTLVGEALRMLDSPITEIETLPMPAAVLAQYAADVAYHRNRGQQ